MPLLDLKAQHETLREPIARAIAGVVEDQRFVLGPEVERLEAEIAEYVGVEHAVGCASGTDALILSLAALGVGDGDRVLTSPFSFFASASCAYRVGARPAFADIDPDTFQLDPAAVEAAWTPSVRAIVPVHLFGHAAPMDALARLARDRGAFVIEDAAQALGARFHAPGTEPVRVGALGDTGCTSFFPTKNLGGFGDGGMIVTGDPDLADRLRQLRVHGGRQMYEHRWVGWNSRLDALQAAVLRVKLPRLDGWARARGERAARYDRWLTEAGLVREGRLRLPRTPTGSDSVHNQYTIRAHDRDALREHLTANGIGHGVYYPAPLHLQPCFAELGYREGAFPVAERACREVLSLPVYPELAEEDQRRVVDAIASFYDR